MPMTSLLQENPVHHRRQGRWWEGKVGSSEGPPAKGLKSDRPPVGETRPRRALGGLRGCGVQVVSG